MVRRLAPTSLAAALVLGSSLLARVAAASPPEHERSAVELRVSGRVIEAGGERRGVAGAVVLIVDAPASARPGKRAHEPLDPDAIAWMRRAETDTEGHFVIDEVPAGKVRVVVVAPGYTRFEQWAALDGASGTDELDLYIRPDLRSDYRTVVESEPEPDYAVEPEHVLDGQQGRGYAGSGDDPLLAAQNLPGVARSPLGLGLIGFRGGDPREAGLYVDGHPVPRAFHVLPIASVLSPPMVAQVQLSPGNYSAAYGSFGGGLVEIESRPGGREGIHGQAHLDLFDFGTTVSGAVGKGSVHVGVRRSHVGDVLRAIDALPVGSPHFWDYLARFDYPLRPGHELTVRALGAGDRLTDDELFDFGASFHRFDLEYRRSSEDWTMLVSPSLRLDGSRLIRGNSELRRVAEVYSLRAAFTRRTQLPWLKLEFGSDLVVERWRRQQRVEQVFYTFDGEQVPYAEPRVDNSRGDQMRLGMWFGVPLELGAWRLVPAARANLFAYSGYPQLRLDPRVDLRGPVHPRVELLAALGMYSTPVVLVRTADSDLIDEDGEIGDGRADVPQYLLTYFEPGIQTDAEDRSSSATYVIHASTGVRVDLPWDLEARATGFWREGLPKTLDRTGRDPYYYGRRRSMGLELLLRRSLVSGVVDGWVGYTLMWARVDTEDGSWLPAVFDQRHNFVALLSANLPRGFRLGLRFRLVSGNPETPVVGRQIGSNNGRWSYRPIRAPRGTTYQPLFHQLDLRLDKQWVLDRTSVTAYLDVQNVYNRLYPEVWIYTSDWAERRSLIGLPIYPSLGVQVDF
ncbi:TonB-dependent receptor [Enhygromyxa salina]|uniref:TonB-dependent receptor n=1 Tax=Enhygromyxa salina TaxID=215803 RepID=UPI0015E5FC8C|nr:TonB-dependent receptor [Enhygromyxa salina]